MSDKKYNEIAFVVYDPCDRHDTKQGMEYFKKMCEILTLNDYDFKVTFDGMCAIIQYASNLDDSVELVWIDTDKEFVEYYENIETENTEEDMNDLRVSY